jgi:phage host-nuclease inhibitor protein Gam
VLFRSARVDQRADLAKSYIERIRSWLDSANAADIDSIDYLSSLLKPWVEAEVAKQRRSRSVLLPTGTAQLRKLPDKVEIVNLNAALAYCKENLPGLVITREDLSKTELKKAVFDGNAIPGVEAQLGRDELFIRPAAQA